jgi:hypothetical protein
VFDAFEPRVNGVLVYLDMNGDGAFDAGEPSRTTSALGDFEFLTLARGLYGVRIVVPSSLEQVFPSAGAGHARLVEDQVVEVTFGLAPPVIVVPVPPPEFSPPVADRAATATLPQATPVRPIQSGGPIQSAPPSFIGGGGGELSPLTSGSERPAATRDPWLQAIELEVEELLPALAEVMSSGVFEADPGDPPPPLRRVKDAKVTQVALKPGVVAAANLTGVPSSDGWSMWWWSLAPISALAGGLWWRYGSSIPWRSTARHFPRRANTRLK